jgi:aspartyl protease family protein
VRAVAPLLVVVAALAALLLTPPERPLIGLGHADFARGALGVSVLLWLTLSGLARAGAAGAARAFLSATIWTGLALALVALYAYRFEITAVADRVWEELDPSPERIGAGGEAVLRRRWSGEFIVPGTVNGRPVSFVFDTGASAVVLTAEDAAAAGLKFSRQDYSVDVTTANGATTSAPARLDRVAVGGIVERDVRALVARPGVLRQSLLGMSFLERLKSYAVEGGRLVLKGRSRARP